jgi:GTP-binding protein EngB required for normal cell division
MEAKKTVQRDEKLRKRFKCFRILVIGRANAGKTTILQKVCNTNEQPEVFDGKGHKIDTTVVSPSSTRGIHDIENELVFKNNPGFIFHDSRGFEAGGDSELGIVKDFIAQRARRKRLEHQLHAIWYCIPVDNPRPVTAAENSFFSECGTGKVPVVVVFTKMDELDSKAWNKFVGQNMSREEAKQRAPEQSLSIAKSQYMSELLARRYPPKGSVYMRDMHKENTECGQLIEETVSVLDDSNLQLILVSTQQVNIELCIKHAQSRALMNQIFEHSSIKARIGNHTATLMTVQDQKDILNWFPHIVSLAIIN